MSRFGYIGKPETYGHTKVMGVVFIRIEVHCVRAHVQYIKICVCYIKIQWYYIKMYISLKWE